MKLSNIIGFSSLALSAGLWFAPVFNNENLFPESRICFRPQKIINQDNAHLLNCDSNDRVGVILTSIFDSLDKNNIEFSNKVASDSITAHFDSNLAETKNFQIASVFLGIAALTSFCNAEKAIRDRRNKEYHAKRLEFVTNEAIVNEQLYPANPLQIAVNTELYKKEIAVKMSEDDKVISENSLITAQNIKAVEKLTETKTQPKQPKDGSDLLFNRKEALIDALQKHEDGWLWYFIDNQTPLWLIGRQGSGKTWTLASIALIRKYCLDIQVGYVIDEHGNGEDNKPIWDLLNPQQICSDPTAIKHAFNEIATSYMERINDGKNSKINQVQDVVDEYTTYKVDELIGESADNWCRKHMKDSRKAYRWTVAATHNDTKATFPEGTYNQRLSSTNMLKKKSQDGKTPLAACSVVRGFYDAEGEEIEDFKGNFPIWFTPKILHGHLTGGEEIEF